MFRVFFNQYVINRDVFISEFVSLFTFFCLFKAVALKFTLKGKQSFKCFHKILVSRTRTFYNFKVLNFFPNS